jgi:hypothetical protein
MEELARSPQRLEASACHGCDEGDNTPTRADRKRYREKKAWVQNIYGIVILVAKFSGYGLVEKKRVEIDPPVLNKLYAGRNFMISLRKKSLGNLKSQGVSLESFNLFRRKEVPELLCAVPEDRIVPEFIAGESWEFGGKITSHSPHQPGFDGSAASAAARYNGFYLFHAWKPCDPVQEQGAPPEAV